MNCDLCGKTGTLYKTEIEGVRMNACETCARHGKIFHEIRQELPKQKEKEQKRQVREDKPSVPAPEVIQLIMKDYSSKIKNAREHKGLKQEDFAKKINEKESVIHQLESGHMKPNLELAQKLEHALGIKIIEEITMEPEEMQGGKPKGNGPLTLGDMINIKKR